MITIVTSRTYLLCESINSITLQFSPERVTNTRYIPYYDIYIDFAPQVKNNNNKSSSDDSHILTIRVAGEQVALKTFKEIVAQIREQLPDQFYLDKMMESILSGEKDINDEPSEIEISGVREKKGRLPELLKTATPSRRRRKR